MPFRTISNFTLALSIVVTLLVSSTLQAGDAEYVPSYGYIPPEKSAPPTFENSLKDWTFEITTGASFGNVRDSSGGYDTTSIPFALTFAYRLDDVTLDDFLGGGFRGYTEFVFRPRAGYFTLAQESYYAQLELGPRYNFVQPGWDWIPFVEGTVGFAFTDSNPIALGSENAERQDGLGQDFSFTFSATIGVRYNIDDEQFIRFQARYWHASNAGLSEPEALNKPLDELGPEIVYGFGF